MPLHLTCSAWQPTTVPQGGRHTIGICAAAACAKPPKITNQISYQWLREPLTRFQVSTPWPSVPSRPVVRRFGTPADQRPERGSTGRLFSIACDGSIQGLTLHTRARPNHASVSRTAHGGRKRTAGGALVLDLARDPTPVLGSPRKCLEEQDVERRVQQIDRITRHWPYSPNLVEV